MDENGISFLPYDNIPRHMNFDGSGERKIINAPVSGFINFENDIYYVGMSDKELYRISDGKQLNPSAEVRDLILEGEYLRCTFTPESKYTELIFDKAGNNVYQSGDAWDLVLISGNRLIFVKKI